MLGTVLGALDVLAPLFLTTTQEEGSAVTPIYWTSEA